MGKSREQREKDLLRGHAYRDMKHWYEINQSRQREQDVNRAQTCSNMMLRAGYIHHVIKADTNRHHAF